MVPRALVFGALWLILSLGVSAVEQRLFISVTPDGVADVTHTVFPRGDENVSLLVLDPSISQAPDILMDSQSVEMDLNENLLFFEATSSVREIRVHYKSTALTGKEGTSWSVRLANLSPLPKGVVVRLPPQTEVTHLEPWGSIRLTRDGLTAQWKTGALGDGTAFVQYSPIIIDANDSDTTFSGAEDALQYAWIVLAMVIVLALAWVARGAMAHKK